MPRGETWGVNEVCGNPGCGRVVPWRRAFCWECEPEVPEAEREERTAEVFAERARMRTEAGVPFLAEMSASGWGYGVAGPDGSVRGWGSYQSERAAEEAEWHLTRAYEWGRDGKDPDPDE